MARLKFSCDAIEFLVRMLRAYSKVADKFSINQWAMPRGATPMMMINELQENGCIEAIQRDHYRFTHLGYPVAQGFATALSP
jgi:hypothetical protein